MIRKPTFLVLAAASAVLAVAGCGGGGGGNSSTSASSAPAAPSSTPSQTTSGGGGGGGATLKLSADPTGALAFDKKSLSAKAGKVTINMDNPAPLPHGIAVQGAGLNKIGKIVNKGGVSTVSVTLKPGKYTFYCPVPGHRQGGMVGTLTVQ